MILNLFFPAGVPVATMTENNSTLKTTDEEHFQKYPCFYCDKVIENEELLLKHRLNYHGVSDTPRLFSLPIRCKRPQSSQILKYKNPSEILQLKWLSKPHEDESE